MIELVRDYWTAEEIAAIVLERTGKIGSATLKNGKLMLDFDTELVEHERVDLETYFSAEHDLPAVDEKARRKASLARLRSFTDGSETTMNVKDIRTAVRALAELMGVEL